MRLVWLSLLVHIPKINGGGAAQVIYGRQQNVNKRRKISRHDWFCVAKWVNKMRVDVMAPSQTSTSQICSGVRLQLWRVMNISRRWRKLFVDVFCVMMTLSRRKKHLHIKRWVLCWSNVTRQLTVDLICINVQNVVTYVTSFEDP